MFNIWYEKYRPQTLNDYVFASNAQKNTIASFIEQQSFPHLLLSGGPGTGKSTLAQILMNECEIDPVDQLHLNASIESGIQVVREKIMNFCYHMPMSHMKVVTLEEFDRFSIDAQKSLRQVIEQFEKTVRFIFTCNYETKIIDAIKSRCQVMYFDSLDEDSISELVLQIIESEDLTYDHEDHVFQHIEQHKPDVRKIIVSMQQSTHDGLIAPPTDAQEVSHDGLDEWEHIWKTQPTLEALLPLCASADHNTIHAYFRCVYENVNQLPEQLQEPAVVLSAVHLYRSETIADQEMNLKAFLYRLFHQIEE